MNPSEPPIAVDHSTLPRGEEWAIEVIQGRATDGGDLAMAYRLGVNASFRLLSSELYRECKRFRETKGIKTELYDDDNINVLVKSVLASPYVVPDFAIDILDQWRWRHGLSFEMDVMTEALQPALHAIRITPRLGMRVGISEMLRSVRNCRQILSERVMESSYVGNTILAAVTSHPSTKEVESEVLQACKMAVEELSFDFEKMRGKIVVLSQIDPVFEELFYPVFAKPDWRIVVQQGFLGWTSEKRMLADAMKADPADVYSFLAELTANEFSLAMTEPLLAFLLSAGWTDPSYDKLSDLIARPGFLEGHEDLIIRLVNDKAMRERLKRARGVADSVTYSAGYVVTLAFLWKHSLQLHIPSDDDLVKNSGELIAKHLLDDTVGVLRPAYTVLFDHVAKYLARQWYWREIGMDGFATEMSPYANEERLPFVVSVRMNLEMCARSLGIDGEGWESKIDEQLPICAALRRLDENLLWHISDHPFRALALRVNPEHQRQIAMHNELYIAAGISMGLLDEGFLEKVSEPLRAKLKARLTTA